MTTKPPDYKAEAREWCRRADPGKSIIWEEDIESLAALLERLCGEASKEQSENFRKVEDRYIDEIRDYVFRLAEAQKEIDQAREEGFRECDGQWQMVVGFAVTGMEREKVIAQVREEGRREMGQKIEGLIRDRLGPAYFDIVEHMLREAKP